MNSQSLHKLSKTMYVRYWNVMEKSTGHHHFPTLATPWKPYTNMFHKKILRKKIIVSYSELTKEKPTSGFPWKFFLNFKDLGSTTWLFIWSSNKTNIIKKEPQNLISIQCMVWNKHRGMCYVIQVSELPPILQKSHPFLQVW